MKKLVVLCITAIALYACNSSKTDKNSFTIEGKVVPREINGKMVFLQKLDEKTNSFVNIDSVMIKDSVFVLKGKADTVGIGSLYIADMFDIPVVLEPGKIRVSISQDMIPSISGTAFNDSLQAFFNRMNALQEENKNILSRFPQTELTPDRQAELDQQMDAVSEKSDATIIAFLKNNINNPAGKYFAADFLPMFEPEVQEELLSVADDQFKSSERVQMAIAELEAVKKIIGTPYKDFASYTSGGRQAHLSDYAGKGKYVLVDFWASWCVPCRVEMPELAALYDKYKTKDFEIVGVSLDENSKNWNDAIAGMKMTWPQLSDLKEWNSSAARIYDVRSIPFTVLIDKDGKIIAMKLRGTRLAKKLEKLLQ
jgi:thiol-disulfide isomerase/thioredoxin